MTNSYKEISPATDAELEAWGRTISPLSLCNEYAKANEPEMFNIRSPFSDQDLVNLAYAASDKTTKKCSKLCANEEFRWTIGCAVSQSILIYRQTYLHLSTNAQVENVYAVSKIILCKSVIKIM